jgi:hypothetical protein
MRYPLLISADEDRAAAVDRIRRDRVAPRNCASFRSSGTS